MHDGERDDPDRDLMDRVRRGDALAFETLYDRRAPQVMAFVYRLCRDRATAEDLTQDTFLRAWQAAPRWQPRARVVTWLLTIARRRWWKVARRRRQRPGREAEAARRARREAETPSRADDATMAARLEDAVAALTDRQRLAFVLVRLLDLPYAEAARIAGVRLGTLKSRLAAAEAALRRRLPPPSTGPSPPD